MEAEAVNDLTVPAFLIKDAQLPSTHLLSAALDTEFSVFKAGDCVVAYKESYGRL